MPDFPKNASLTDAQKWVEDMCKERGFDKNPPLEIFLRFTEEVGELAKAIRKVSGMRVEVRIQKKKKKKSYEVNLPMLLSTFLTLRILSV